MHTLCPWQYFFMNFFAFSKFKHYFVLKIIFASMFLLPWFLLLIFRSFCNGLHPCRLSQNPSPHAPWCTLCNSQPVLCKRLPVPPNPWKNGHMQQLFASQYVPLAYEFRGWSSLVSVVFSFFMKCCKICSNRARQHTNQVDSKQHQNNSNDSSDSCSWWNISITNCSIIMCDFVVYYYYGKL